MDAITQLFAQMSIENIILLLGLILCAAKALSELLEWAYNKAKKYFNSQEEEQDRKDDIAATLLRLEKKTDERGAEVAEVKKSISLIQQRLQDSTRSYIIDKYHFYVDEIGAIDEAALQDLERRYFYYKEAGGDTFIEVRMKEVRALPVISASQLSQHQKDTIANVRNFLGSDEDGR